MTLRLTKPSLSLPRPQSAAKPETSARVGPAVTGKPDPTKPAGQAQGQSPVRNAAEQIANTADRFESAASKPGGIGTSVGGQPIPEHQKPWNKETYGEKLDRNSDIYPGIFDNLPSGAEQGAESTGTTVGGQPIPEHEQPWNQETYGEKIDRNRADRGLPPLFVEPDDEISSPNGQGTGETYGERIDQNRAERGLPPLYSEPEPGAVSPHGPGSGETYGERIDRNRADRGLPPL